MAAPPRPRLPTVTLCAADTRSPGLAMKALRHCMAQADFARVILFTHGTDAGMGGADDGIEVVDIGPLPSAQAYSDFMLQRLVGWVRSDHVLIVQWDGFIVDTQAWDPAFLDTDYLGAPWGKAPNGFHVGNGGFSLRSRKLLLALAAGDPRLRMHHPEDICICQTNRALLEQHHGIRFAPLALARRFAFENEAPTPPCFGFHGVYNFPRVLPPEALQGWLDAIPAAVIDGRDGYKTARNLARQGDFRRGLSLLDSRAGKSRWEVKATLLRAFCRVALKLGFGARRI